MNILGRDAQFHVEYESYDWNTVIIQYSFIKKSDQDQRCHNLKEINEFFGA